MLTAVPEQDEQHVAGVLINFLHTLTHNFAEFVFDVVVA